MAHIAAGLHAVTLKFVSEKNARAIMHPIDPSTSRIMKQKEKNHLTYCKEFTSSILHNHRNW